MPNESLFHPQLVHDWLSRSAGLYPSKTALVADGKRWTYQDLDQHSQSVGWALQAQGARSRDRVVVFLDNSAEVVIALYGILKAMGVFVIVSGALKAQKLTYILENSGACALITHTSKRSVVGEALEKIGQPCRVLWVGPEAEIPTKLAAVSESWSSALSGWGTSVRTTNGGGAPAPRRSIDADLAALIYTSGSTGEPKGVMSSHSNMISAARSIIQYVDNREGDVVLGVLPLSFDYGLYQAIMTVMFGGTLVIERSFLYLHRVLERIPQEGVTGFPIVPTILAMFLKMQDLAQYDLSSLRYMTNTGAAVPVEYVHKVGELFPGVRFFSMFGLTECKRVCYLPPEELDMRPSSVGKAMPNCEVSVVDENGVEVSPGTVGELVIRGSNVMRGYWKDPELTARVFRRAPDTGERILYSGDYFRCDEDGFLYFVGRKDDMIKTRGERVSPKEVENMLCSMTGLLEAAVVPVPDEILGQAIKAFVVTMPGVELSEKQILKYCTASMESFMVPKYIAFSEELPKTVNGKIDKKLLLNWEVSKT